MLNCLLKNTFQLNHLIDALAFFFLTSNGLHSYPVATLPNSKRCWNRPQKFQAKQVGASQLPRDGLTTGLQQTPADLEHLGRRLWERFSTRRTLPFAKLWQCVQPVKNDRGGVPAQQAFNMRQRDERSTIWKQQVRMSASHREKMLEEYWGILILPRSPQIQQFQWKQRHALELGLGS